MGEDVDVRHSLQNLIAWGSRLAEEYTRTRASLAAGGLAYFVALSAGPAALAFGALAGVVLDPEDLREVLARLSERSPETLSDLKPILDALAATVESASTTAFSITALVSVLIAVYAASKVVVGLRLAMNSIFDVASTRNGFVERGIATLVTLAVMVVGVGVVLVLTLLPRIREWLGLAPESGVGGWVVEWVIAVVLTYLAARVILQRAHDGHVRVSWTSLGPVVVTVGVLAATVGVTLYVRFSANFSVTVVLFGTAVVLLLWLYLCFVALLWGAIIEADRQRKLSATTSAVDRPPVP